jgi:hypothetical protein
MTGLKSGSGDDLWGDDDETTDEADDDGADGTGSTTADSPPTDADRSSDRNPGTDASTRGTGDSSLEPSDSEADNRDGQSVEPGGSPTAEQPYIVRRAVQDKSVQYERDERLTFFVHDDVTEGERDLVTDLESALGRDVPKFDVREAVYRAALRNPDDVLDELLEMGYSMDEDG